MELIQNRTKINGRNCIEFANKKPFSKITDYLKIVDESGCWSNIGKIKLSEETSFQHKLSLDSYCLNQTIIIHELLHALGIIHEHQRPDRDSWIELNMQNMKKGDSS